MSHAAEFVVASTRFRGRPSRWRCSSRFRSFGLHISPTIPLLVCHTSSQNVANVINSIVRDPRTHVEGVQGIAVPHAYARCS